MLLLDILLGGLLAYGLVRGMWNGLFVELASVVALYLGIYIAILFSSVTRDFISESVSRDPKIVQATAFALTFFAVVVAVLLLAKVFTSLANFTGIAIINRLLGGVFGFVKMILILSVTLGVLDSLVPDTTFVTTEELDQSKLYNPVRKTAVMVFPLITEAFTELRPDAEEEFISTP